MKISGGYKSQNHWAHYFSTCPLIFLDGVSVDHVCEADDVDGYVVIELQEGGRPKLNDDGVTIATMRLTGKVEFIGDSPSQERDER